MTIEVTNGDDSGSGSLRQAIADAAAGDTIRDNTAFGSSGGGITNGDSGIVTLANTIIANSLSGGDYTGTVPTLQGNNIVEDGSVAGATAVDPLLTPLQDNGGPTLTHLPLSGSPAINAGDNSVTTGAGLTTDQRGLTRIVADTVDIGAVEVGTNELQTPTPTATAAGAFIKTFRRRPPL